jgi:glutaredoxin 3
MKPTRVRLFVKPQCGWCHRARRWLEQHDIECEVLDVFSDPDIYDEMVRLSGQELAPVVDVDGRVLADFGPDELGRFWNDLEQEHADAAR